MRKIILTFLFILLNIIAYNQEVLRVQNGSSLTLQPGAEMTVLGDVAFDNGSAIQNNGILTIKQYGSSGTANFFDNTITGYSYGFGKFVFSSTIQHNIYSNNNFGRIDVDAAGLNLASNITANKWWLANGTVNTNTYTAIVLGNASSDLEAASTNINFANSWINGSLRRYINPTVVDNYLFVTGKGSNKNFVEFTNLTAGQLAGVQYIDASFSDKVGTDDGLVVTENGTPYTIINNAGVWHLKPDNAPVSGKYDLKLYTNGFTGLSDNAFAILQRPNLSAAASEWNVPDGSSVNANNGAGRLVADGYALRKNLTVFEQFGIGQLLGALPVTLTNFNAKRFSKLAVQLNWQTQTESNNKGFGIERRFENETSFGTNGFVDSKAPGGNSSINLDYSFTDNNAYTGITYYRLKQTDKDGRIFYSLIKAVSGLSANAVGVMLWPNPGKGQFSIKIDNNTGNKHITIANLQGQVIRKINIVGSQQVNVYDLAAGVYVINIPNAFGVGQDFKEKVIVVK